MGLCQRSCECVPTLLHDLAELHAWMTRDTHCHIDITVNTVDRAMLGRVWQEPDYWFDVCHVTKVLYIEHL